MLLKIVILLAVLWAASLVLRMLTGLFFMLLLAGLAVIAFQVLRQRWRSS